MKKRLLSTRFIWVLALASSLAHCASSGGEEEAVTLTPVLVESDAPAPAVAARSGSRSMNITYGAEKQEKSLKSCAYYAIPDGVLGLGLIAVIPNPLTSLIALGFIGGHYYTCYIYRQEDMPRQLDIGPVVNAAVETARRETAEQLKKDFVQVKDKIDNKSQAVDQAISNIRQTLKDSAEEQRRAIEKTGARVLKELYEQLDVVRHSKIEIHEEDREDYIPPPRKYLNNDGQKP